MKLIFYTLSNCSIFRFTPFMRNETFLPHLLPQQTNLLSTLSNLFSSFSLRFDSCWNPSFRKDAYKRGANRRGRRRRRRRIDCERLARRSARVTRERLQCANYREDRFIALLLSAPFPPRDYRGPPASSLSPPPFADGWIEGERWGTA